MQAGRVQVDVDGAIVVITWEERDMLLAKLRNVVGCESIIDRFWASGASTPVELNADQRSRLRVRLELWGLRVLPDGLATLLLALVRADPGGHSGTASVSR